MILFYAQFHQTSNTKKVIIPDTKQTIHYIILYSMLIIMTESRKKYEIIFYFMMQ